MSRFHAAFQSESSILVALVIFALPHIPESWIDKSADLPTREAARVLLRRD